MASGNGSKKLKSVEADQPIAFGAGQLIRSGPFAGAAGVLPGSMSEDGRTYVVLQIECSIGSLGFIITPEIADQLAQILHSASQQASSGLIIPT